MARSFVLGVFQQAVALVPAYADYLSQQNIDAATIHTSTDFKKLPLTSKKTYLQQYNLEDLVLGGTLHQPLIFCSTSGSTGAPYYFPRSEILSTQYARLLQDYLLQTDPGRKKRTLVLLGFGMGVWIGGVITLRAFEIAAKQLKYPLSILPVGYNKTELYKALRQLAPQYDQTIIVGYPPFIKQIVDEAPAEGIDFGLMHIRLIFAAESFTETFRDYLCQKTGADPLLDTLNIYGTADIGAMAYETPLSIMIRRLASKDSELFASLFGQIQKTPTLAQYNPRYISFESVNDEIVLTGKAVLPLVRYAVGDNGGTISFARVKHLLKKHGYDVTVEATKAGIEHTLRTNPFVFVYERKNFSVTLHGINIYPEFVKEALLDETISQIVTGRFTMLTEYDALHNQYLAVHVELYKGAKSSAKLKQYLTEVIRKGLITRSSEFAEIAKNPESNTLLHVELWPQDDPAYFAPGTKQKWVQAEK